jgi:HEAT repeat protein
VATLARLAKIGGDSSFRLIAESFDDPAEDVRNAAARALYDLNPDHAASFTRALREGSPERRRKIGAAIAASGLARDAINGLIGDHRDKTYDAFAVLFLMAKAGEVQTLFQVVREHPNLEVRLATVKLLALSNPPEALAAFRRLVMMKSYRRKSAPP